MFDYPTLKAVHVTAAALSIGGYALRGGLMLRASPLLDARWVRIVPHVVDTVLLASAVGLALMLRQYPLVHGWLTAKVLALAAYRVYRRGRYRPALRPRRAGRPCPPCAYADAAVRHMAIFRPTRLNSPPGRRLPC